MTEEEAKSAGLRVIDGPSRWGTSRWRDDSKRLGWWDERGATRLSPFLKEQKREKKKKASLAYYHAHKHEEHLRALRREANRRYYARHRREVLARQRLYWWRKKSKRSHFCYGKSRRKAT